MEKIRTILKLRFTLYRELFLNFSALILFILIMNGCKKDSNNDNYSEYTIYSVGNLHGIGACYWEGSSRTDLGGVATSIFVSNSNIYLAGMNKTSCYWKNTMEVDLDGTPQVPTSIFVSNGNVYTAGQSCYWVNSERRELGDSVSGISISSIFVVDTTVYVAGSYGDFGIYRIPCYWVGKTRVDLPAGNSAFGGVSSIYVSNGIVYTCGYYGEAPNNNSCYWTGVVKTDLPGGSNASYITMDGGIIYAAGTDVKADLCYWKGTSKINITLERYATYGIDVASFCVKGGTFFTSGTYYKPDPNDMGNGFNFPCYWIGNTKVDLPIPINNYSYSNQSFSIFVEQKK